MPRRIIFVAMWLLLLVLIGGSPLGAAEPAKSEALLSWNESASKKSIVDFVDRVTPGRWA